MSNLELALYTFEAEDLGSPVVILVDDILRRGLEAGCSEIHIQRKFSRGDGIVQHRQGGILDDIGRVAAVDFHKIIARVKVIANLDITERERVQGNRRKVVWSNEVTDLEFMTVPAEFDERIVVRLRQASEAPTAERIERFARDYSSDDLDFLLFAWNGANGSRILDINAEFRHEVCGYSIAHPGAVSFGLLRDLAIETAKCSAEAFGVPDYFHELVQMMLNAGGAKTLDDLLTILSSSFDTFGACHRIVLASDVVMPLLQETERRLEYDHDRVTQARLENARELFQKLLAGNAAENWYALVPPESN